MNIHLNITVTGLVQGVSYRASALKKAQSLGLRGIVKNLLDGSVYIEAEGEMQVLEELLSWCKTGPKRAVVESVLYEPAALRNYTTFEILK